MICNVLKLWTIETDSRWSGRRGHYGRALEEAIQTHSGHWPLAWGGKNPLHGSGSFGNMTPEQRVSICDGALMLVC